MLEIDNKLPIFQLGKDSDIKDGDIVQLSIENNSIVLIKSDGQSPIGWVKKILTANYSTLIRDDILFAEIIFTRFFGYTDNFESDQIYPTNANLYVSSNSKLTTKKYHSNQYPVGMIISSPTKEKSSLRFLWY